MIHRQTRVVSLLSVRILLSLSLLFTGATTQARELMLQDTVQDQKVLIFDDGFWRFSDSGGKRCTKVAFVGELCALPSSWAPFPQADTKALRPRFVRAAFEGFVTSLTPVDGPVEADSVNRTLTDLADFDGEAPTVLQKKSARLGELQGQQIVYAHGNRVVAFSVFDQNGRILFFQSQRRGFTLFHKDHETAHQDLINAVVLEAFDG
ncbi:hypothetical protein [Tateyamaria sp. syn59]|uniref:hypothetical protein n=1 Tax=Tateyamaria sp. syn59 TaxID=2576942 RepID=UPI0011BE750E|nr:hypothetical protein [Tateyamaria sp. syn59]